MMVVAEMQPLGKRAASRRDDDIVYSVWKHAAVPGIAGENGQYSSVYC